MDPEALNAAVSSAQEAARRFYAALHELEAALKTIAQLVGERRMLLIMEEIGLEEQPREGGKG